LINDLFFSLQTFHLEIFKEKISPVFKLKIWELFKNTHLIIHFKSSRIQFAYIKKVGDKMEVLPPSYPLQEFFFWQINTAI